MMFCDHVNRAVSVLTLLCLISQIGNAAEVVDFNRDIRPILSNHCFQCHGSDDQTREAGLRLDVRGEAVAAEAIIPGDDKHSALVERVTEADAGLVMPPPDANKPLSADQIKLLKRWIREGAAYDSHWAFRKIEKPSVPELESDWIKSPIDAFVLRKMRQKNLTPSPEATRATQIRRLYQDLLGLLPTVEETDAFIADTSPTAWETLVDRLLKSPHYGERWGRHWLDQARYADSNGYTIDGSRVMWPYRDWVINAINNDLPFDQFTIQQLAGDLMPDASKPQLVATAFHRNTMINEEGGVKADQFRHEAIIDRVNTTGAVWLGLTVGCAQCHTHKFDPLTHTEYYQLYAFFNGAADANNTGKTISVFEDEMFGWSAEREQQANELLKLEAELKKHQSKTGQSDNLAAANWSWQAPEIESAKADSDVDLQRLADGSFLAPGTVAPNDTYRVAFTLPFTGGHSENGITAVRLRVLPDKSLPNRGPGRAGNGNFVLTDVHVEIDGRRFPFIAAWADHSQPNYPIVDAIDGRNDTGWAINVDAAAKARGTLMNAPHEAVFVLSKADAKEVSAAAADRPMNFVMKHAANENYQVGRFAVDVTSSPVPQSDAAEAPDHISVLRERLTELRQLFPAGVNSVPQMIMEDHAKPPHTYRLDRGDFLTPDEEQGPLSPGVPAALQTANSNRVFSSRLDLATWLVSEQNPLTARVFVNRVWSKYFGRGLVETENDFGFQGALPTHPELLDWLGAEFMQRGWSMKALHRLIVTSATYRQSSHVSETHLAADVGNDWLSRQSRFRVEAEIVRDQGLSASGLLYKKIGGPGVYPPQPDGIYAFTQNKKNWPTDTGPNRYRRTMYTMFYRSAPYPLLTTFDAPDFSTVCTQRVRSNTPLQSLTVANDRVFMELAEGLAGSLFADSAEISDADRCRQLFRRCLTRQPEDEELQVLLHFLERERQRFSQSKDDAAKVVQLRANLNTSPVVIAAWTSVARVLLNTDEFVTRN